MVSRAKLILIMEQHEIPTDLAFLIDKFRYGKKCEKIEHVVSISRFGCYYYQKYYISLMSIFYELDGKKHGKEIAIDFKDNIIIERTYKNGLKDGMETIYNPIRNSNITEINHYNSGTLHGICYKFYDDERVVKVKYKNIFNNGYLIKSTENKDGVTIVKTGLSPLKWKRI